MDSEYWTRWQRRRFGRRRLLGSAGAFSAGLAGLALVGCGDDDDDDDESPDTTASPGTGGEDTPRQGGTLRMGTFLDVLGIDPHIEVSVGLTQAAKVYTFLGGFSSKDQTFNAIVAEDYETPSETEFIFKLRQDVKFANVAPVNGRQLTAEDVLYSYERFRDHPQAQNNDFFKTVVDSMTVVDLHTFKLTTKAPYAESLSEIGGIQKAIVAKEEVEAKGDLQAGGVGAGGYIFESYEKGSGTTLRRNPDYFIKGKPYLDKLSWQVILDMGTLLQAYKSGQHDTCGALLTKLDYDELKRDSNLVNHELPALHYGSLAVNASVPPFDNPQVREALWLGIDRQQIIDKVFQGAARKMAILNPGLDFWVLPDSELESYLTPDYAKAKQLLSAAGYPDGFDMEIETSNGVQIYIDHVEVIVPELKKIGVNATPKISDLTTYLSTKLFTGNFNATVFTHNPYETPKIPLGFYHSNGIGNGSWWNYSNPEVDAVLEKQAAELDVAKRKELVYEAQRVLLKDAAPLMNMAAPTLFLSWRNNVGGIDPTLRTYQTFTLNEYLKS